MCEAAAARIPAELGTSLQNFELGIVVLLIALVAAFDVASIRRLHSVTLGAGATVIVFMLLRMPLARTEMWRAFGRWAMSLLGTPA
jgi:hypothetical protein